MKRKSKGNSILSVFALIALIFLFVVEMCFAYFTGTSDKSGDLTFGSLQVNFAYRAEGSGAEIVYDDVLNVIPSSDQIKRGDEFDICLMTDSGDRSSVINNLMFYSPSSSADSYVRFRVNAYVVKSSGNIDTSTNYGQYFRLIVSADVSYQTITNGGATNTIYYLNPTLGTTQNTYLTFATGMQLLNEAPLSILNTDIQITITFEAVQASNKAYLSVFDDGWGYSSSWT